MLDRTPFLQFLPPRIDQARRRLGWTLWTDLDEKLIVEQSTTAPAHRPLDSVTFQTIERFPHHWGKVFEHCWFRVRIPASTQPGQPRYLHWRDQGEATLYVDGAPYAGFDPGHLRILLPQSLSDAGGVVHIASVCCRTGVWVTGEAQGISDQGSRLDPPVLCVRDEDKWQAFCDLDVLLELAILEHRRMYRHESDWPSGYGYRKPVELLSARGRKLIDGLDRAIDVLDRDGPAAMRVETRRLLDAFPADHDAMTATLVGHAHIDLVWLWPEHVGEFKAVHSIANVLDLQRRYPEHVMMLSQPASYDAVARQEPILFEQVRDAARAGRWVATGATYVESDTQLPCGEALVRSIEIGQKRFSAIRPDGSTSRICWLPDCFGFSGVLPTLLAGFDVPYFFTTKQHWSSATSFPYSSFRWRGNDGSSVLGHVAWEHYNLTAAPAELQRAEINHRQVAVHDDALVCTGYGDGGGGPNDLMCERARRLANLAGMPRTKWGCPEAFFDRMARDADRLPAWSGEIYLEAHRGVQTTHAAFKRAFRAAERALQTLEAVHAVRGAGPIDDASWKRLIFMQFHDCITGTSVPQVYEDGLIELQQIASDAISRARTLLGNADGEPALFNPLPIERSVVRDGRLLRLPALGGVRFKDAGIDIAPATVEQGVLENGIVRAVIDADGLIARLQVRGHDLNLRRPTGRVYLMPDHPSVFEAWEIERQTLAAGQEIVTAPGNRTERVENGVATVRFSRILPDGSPLTITYLLRPGSPVLEVEFEVNWQISQALLKYAIETQHRGQLARFGAPYGSSLRPQLSGTLAADAMFEAPASRWMCVSDDGEADGIMLLSEASYGFGARDGLMHVSLLRNASHSNHDHGAHRWTDSGAHRIRLAVGHFSADHPPAEQPAVLVDTLYTDPIEYVGSPIDSPLPHCQSTPGLVAGWVKPLEGGAFVVRYHETLGQRGTLRIAPGSATPPIRVDLRGVPIPSAAPPADRDFIYGPYALVSVQMTC